MNKTPNQSTASDSDLSMLIGSRVRVIADIRSRKGQVGTVSTDFEGGEREVAFDNGGLGKFWCFQLELENTEERHG